MKRIFTTSKIASIARLVGMTTNVIDPSTVLLVYGDDIGSYVKVKINQADDCVVVYDKWDQEKTTINNGDKFLQYVEDLF